MDVLRKRSSIWKLGIRFIFCVGVVAWTFPAFATQKVYSPEVEKGEWGIEARGSYDVDTNELKQKYDVGYGITDKWKTEIVWETEKESGERTDLTEVEWENIFALTEPGKHFVDVGLYLSYVAKLNGNPDAVEWKALLEKDIGKFEHTLNINFEQTVEGNEDNNIEGGIAWRTRYNWMETLRPGIEYYIDFGELEAGNNFDEQKHQIGPVLSGELFEHVEYEVGYLFGISDAAPEGSIKWLLEYEFKF